MGLFDFVKDAGAKIFGGAEDDAAAAKLPSREEVESFHNRRKAARLADAVAKLGFEVEELAIRVDGDTATVSGLAGSQEDREKIVLVVGNTAGIARVDDRMTVADRTEPRFYTVQGGDSLSKIAKEYYGDALKYPVIFRANQPMLQDPDKIYPGQVLRIPPLDD